MLNLRNKTTCSDCCWFKNNKCELGRLEIFEQRGKVQGDPPVIDGLCSAKRDKEWDQTKSIYDEEKVKVDIIIENNDPVEVAGIIEEYEKSTIPPMRYHVITDDVDSCAHLSNEKTYISSIYEEDKIAVVLPKMQGQYVVFSPSKPKEDILQKLNDALFHRMEPIIAVDDIPKCVNKAYMTYTHLRKKKSTDDILTGLKEENDKYIYKWDSL